MDTVELEIAMIKGSYEICRQARRLGYLDDNLDLTGKKPEKVVSSGTRGQGQMGGYIRGFQAGLVFNKQDIAREVEFLRVGRVALLYQSPDGQVSGAWDQESRQWQSLGSDYKNQIRQGLKIANKQIAPELVLLPIKAPEAG